MKIKQIIDQIRFGDIDLTQEEDQVFKEMGNEVLNLCKVLPAPLQNKGMIFLSKFGSLEPGKQFRFFNLFYIPTWSVIYWLNSHNPVFSKSEIKNALAGQAMAMLLHFLDDHLVDKQVKTDHLMLQIRTESWMRFNKAVSGISVSVEGGEEIVREQIDTYFDGIHEPPESEVLEDFLDISRKQVATWAIIPILLAKKIDNSGELCRDIREIYESFFVAWRIVDDMQDFIDDLKNGEKSSIFYSLSDEGREQWYNCRGIPENDLEETVQWKRLLEHIEESDILGSLIKRAKEELEKAAHISKKNRLDGLADEYMAMREGLIESVEEK